MPTPLQRSAILAGLALVASLALGAGLWPEPPRPGGDPAACASQLGASTPDVTGSLESEFQVLSWNLQKTSQPQWRRDLAGLGDGVELAFLQEATTDAAIAEVLPGRSGRAFAPGYRSDDQQTGVLTLSQVAPLLECDLQAMEPWLGTPKAISVTEYALADRRERLLAVNIHAVNFALGLEDYRRQLDQLDQLLQRHPGPTVVAGDFNTWREARQQALGELMRAHGLRGITFQPDHRSTFLGQALDHIFIRGLEATTPRVVPVESSDHNPLLVSLSLP